MDGDIDIDIPDIQYPDVAQWLEREAYTFGQSRVQSSPSGLITL